MNFSLSPVGSMCHMEEADTQFCASGFGDPCHYCICTAHSFAWVQLNQAVIKQNNIKKIHAKLSKEEKIINCQVLSV